MKNTIVLPNGQVRISVAAALREVVAAADFPPTIDFFVEVFTDGDGNEYSPEDGQIRHEQTDGKALAAHMLKASFLSFCESTGTKPRNPYAPWVFDYDGANGSHDCLYEIAIDELRRFAAEYHVNVVAADDNSLMVSPAPVQTLLPAAVPVLRQQEGKIMEWLGANGYDARSLPKQKNGHKTVKAIAKAALDGTDPFNGTTTFNKAWERLRGGKEIQEEVPKNPYSPQI